MKKNKARKLISTLLAVALVFSLCAIVTLAGSEEEGPFMVTEQPAGDTYILGDTATPLSATFEYTAGVLGYLHSDTPIIVRWYWSYENSNADRSNGFDESIVAYGRIIKHTTTHVPATDEVGVKYYYAVLSYAESVTSLIAATQIIPREAVSDPARIEVIAPVPSNQEISVRKVDDEGHPLAGATIVIVSSDGTVYEAVTDANGVAVFSVPEGTYTVSESIAPPGYEGTDQVYEVTVTPNGAYVSNPSTMYRDYPITFVNTESPPEQIVPIRHSFTVRKVDVNGAPLAGAIMRVEGLSDEGIPRVYNVTTNSAGEAFFTVENGTYVLSEYAAPTDYNATDETYNIVVTADGVFFQNSPSGLIPYSPVTYVNKKILTLDKVYHNFAYMQGYPDGTFRPSRNMSRAEAVVMFSRLLSETMDLNIDYRFNCYPDIVTTNPWLGENTTPWYVNQVCFMNDAFLLADYSRDGRFRPDEPVTRAEFATLATHFDNLTLSDTNIFPDVPDDHWAAKYINSAAARGWIRGYPDGTFGPENYITRAEVVTLVNRVLDRQGDVAYMAAHEATLPRTYTDLPTTHWAYRDIMEASIGHNYMRELDIEYWTEFAS